MEDRGCKAKVRRFKSGRAGAPRSKLSLPVAAMPVSSNERNEAPLAGCRWNYI